MRVSSGCATLGAHLFNQGSQHTGNELQGFSACDPKGTMCVSCSEKGKRLNVAVGESHDLGGHKSSLETNATLVLGSRNQAGPVQGAGVAEARSRGPQQTLECCSTTF